MFARRDLRAVQRHGGRHCSPLQRSVAASAQGTTYCVRIRACRTGGSGTLVSINRLPTRYAQSG